MVTLEKLGVPLANIKASALLAGANQSLVTKFFSNFDFPLVDIYSGTWTEFEGFLDKKGMKLLYDKGIKLKRTSSLHYVSEGNRIVGYVADESGVGRLLLKNDDLETVV